MARPLAEEAARLCRALREGDPGAAALIWEASDPLVFTAVGPDSDCPLSLAAGLGPALARSMLVAGADPRRVPELGSAMLLAAAGAPGDLEPRRRLFARLLKGGASPAAPLCGGGPHDASLLARLIRDCDPVFVRCFLAASGTDARVWPAPPGAPLGAADYARQVLGDELKAEWLEGLLDIDSEDDIEAWSE